MAEPHLNRKVLDDLQEVMEDEYPVLLDTFLDDAEDRLRLLRQPKDAVHLMETAHSFKGSSSNMGAQRLAELCNELEQRAKVASPADLTQLVSEIGIEFAIVRPLYEAERSQAVARRN
ncbi:Hpt domain-containing protein [Pseudomonas sp. LB3P31]